MSFGSVLCGLCARFCFWWLRFIENFAAFFREAVFLKSAVGFAGDGVFDEVGGQCGYDVCFAEASSIFQLKGAADFIVTERTLIQKQSQ